MNRSILPRLAAVGATAALTFPLAACGGDDEPAVETTTVTESATGTTSDASGPSRARPESAGPLRVAIDWKDAVARAKRVYDGELTEIDLDDDDGRYDYEITLLRDGREREVHVDAQTGQTRTDDPDDDDGDRGDVFAVDGLIGPDDAMSAALGRVPGRVTDWKLSRDDGGRIEYEIHVQPAGGDDREVTVDAQDGRVVGVDD